MLLPGLLIPISIEVFETNLEYFINEYVNFEYTPNLIYKKSDIVLSGHRYIIFCEQKKSTSSSPIKVGEIDVILVHAERVEVKAAVYEIKHPCNGRDFFDKLYYMIYKKWKVSPDRNDPSSIATNLSIMIGFKTGYFKLPGILSIMPEKSTELISRSERERELSKILESYLSGSDPKPKYIIQNYQSEINKGLPEINTKELSSKLKKRGVTERIMKRAHRIKEIKDKHPRWSQPIVASEYNEKYGKEDFITTSDLQNAYRAMNWDWLRSDRVS